jgi:hypothetical protein
MRPRGHTRSRKMAQRDSVAAETNVGAWTRTTVAPQPLLADATGRDGP